MKILIKTKQEETLDFTHKSNIALLKMHMIITECKTRTPTTKMNTKTTKITVIKNRININRMDKTTINNNMIKTNRVTNNTKEITINTIKKSPELSAI